MMMKKIKIGTDESEFQERGFSFFRQQYTQTYLDKLSEATDRSYHVCRNIQIMNQLEATTDGTVHHLLATGEPIFLDLLDKICSSELNEFLYGYFDGKYIINAFGGVINLPDNPSYVTNIHRDVRFFTGDFPMMMNLLIMLDDFTLENGATYLLDGSHRKSDKPSEQVFYEYASRAVGSRGDVLFFNSNLWHAAGLNKTHSKRRALTLSFTKPCFKQQIDYAKLLGYEVVEHLPGHLKQVLGYFSRIPSNLNEWYQPPERRFYRPGQD